MGISKSVERVLIYAGKRNIRGKNGIKQYRDKRKDTSDSPNASCSERTTANGCIYQRDKLECIYIVDY